MGRCSGECTLLSAYNQICVTWKPSISNNLSGLFRSAKSTSRIYSSLGNFCRTSCKYLDLRDLSQKQSLCHWESSDGNGEGVNQSWVLEYDMELFGNNNVSVSIHATRYSKLRNYNHPGTTSCSNNQLQSADASKFWHVLPSTHLNTQKRYTKKRRKRYTVKYTTTHTK